LILEAKDQ
jgi:hypothetical protein